MELAFSHEALGLQVPQSLNTEHPPLGLAAKAPERAISSTIRLTAA